MLVLLRDICSGVSEDIRYATKDNFTQKVLYPSAHCFLQRPVAKALQTVQACAEEQNLSLKIWDGYRPLHVQWMLWEHTPDEQFVAHPSKGGRHPRGTAVDLTLIDCNKKELVMPTPFDSFSPKAHRSALKNLSQEAIKNRQLLEDLMALGGFIGLQSEWWHFDYEGWEGFEPLDYTFDELL